MIIGAFQDNFIPLLGNRAKSTIRVDKMDWVKTEVHHLSAGQHIFNRFHTHDNHGNAQDIDHQLQRGGNRSGFGRSNRQHLIYDPVTKAAECE